MTAPSAHIGLYNARWLSLSQTALRVQEGRGNAVPSGLPCFRPGLPVAQAESAALAMLPCAVGSSRRGLFADAGA